MPAEPEVGAGTSLGLGAEDWRLGAEVHCELTPCSCLYHVTRAFQGSAGPDKAKACRWGNGVLTLLRLVSSAANRPCCQQTSNSMYLPCGPCCVSLDSPCLLAFWDLAPVAIALYVTGIVVWLCRYGPVS